LGTPRAVKIEALKALSRSELITGIPSPYIPHVLREIADQLLTVFGQSKKMAASDSIDTKSFVLIRTPPCMGSDDLSQLGVVLLLIVLTMILISIRIRTKSSLSIDYL
jgi:hypothetical protein